MNNVKCVAIILKLLNWMNGLKAKHNLKKIIIIKLWIRAVIIVKKIEV